PLNGHASSRRIETLTCPSAKSADQRDTSISAILRANTESGSSSAVERQLPKLNVAGSIPVSRSNPPTICRAPPQGSETKNSQERGFERLLARARQHTQRHALQPRTLALRRP